MSDILWDSFDRFDSKEEAEGAVNHLLEVLHEVKVLLEEGDADSTIEMVDEVLVRYEETREE